MFDTIPFVRPGEDDANKAFFTFIGNNSFLQLYVDDANYVNEQVATFLAFLEAQGFEKDLITQAILEQLIISYSKVWPVDLSTIPAIGANSKLNYILNATKYYIEHVENGNKV